MVLTSATQKLHEHDNILLLASLEASAPVPFTASVAEFTVFLSVVRERDMDICNIAYLRVSIVRLLDLELIMWDGLFEVGLL